jgi:hypothetical protein
MRRQRGHVAAVAAVAAATFAAAGLLACGRPAEPPPEGVVAVYDGGRITAEELDRRVLELPPAERRPGEGEDRVAWLRELARDVAVRRLVVEDARRRGLDREPEVAELRAELRRELVTDLFVERRLPPPEPIAEEELRERYRRERERYQRPARRHLRHLFRRWPEGGDREAVLRELGELRARAVAGEDFAALAREHSDSESRRRGGELGWITAGQFQPELERILFSLEVGVPSEPVPTPEGAHLFLVTEAVEGKDFDFEAVAPLLRRQLFSERQRQALSGLLGDGLPADAFVPTPAELGALIAAGDPAATVLRVGDYHLRLDQLLRRRASAEAQLGAPLPPAAVLESLVWRERLYRHCLEIGFDRRPEVAERLAAATERALGEHFLRRRLQAAAAAAEERLREYHEIHRRRFSEPLRLRVRRLAVPLSDAANAHMARLEAVRPELAAGAAGLAGLAAELGGRVEEPGWQTLEELARRDPRGAEQALELTPGGYSPPYRTETELALIHLLERREPEPLPFTAVRDRVAEEYLRHHGEEVYGELARELLDAAGYRVLEERLEAVATPAPE